MAINTLKALKERRAAAVQAMTDAMAKLRANSADAEARAAFDKSSDEFNKLKQQIADEERIAEVEAEARAATGGPDRVFGKGTEADDPIVNLDSSRYSLLRALDQIAEGREVKGYEGEISQELNKRFGQSSQGFRIPLNLRMDARKPERRNLNTTTGAGILDVVQERDTIIGALRNRVVTARLGATILSDMVGTFEIPRVSGDVSMTWGGESASMGISSTAIANKVTFAPTTVGARSVLSRRFRKQTSIDAENFQRSETMKALAVAMDFGAIAGSGASNQPTGLINNVSTNLIALGANGAQLAWADVVNFETLVANLNADAETMDRMGYLFNSRTRGRLKTTPKVAGQPIFLWENGDTPVNGYRAEVTNILPSNLTKGTSSGVCSAGLFGVWEYLMMAMWGGPDIIIDNLTGAAAGDLNIIVLQDMQVRNRYDEAFTRCVDILT